MKLYIFVGGLIYFSMVIIFTYENYYLLGGILVMSSMIIILTYALAYCIDLRSPPRPSIDFNSNSISLSNGGTVAKNAGLLGLTKEQRNDVLQYLFKTKLFSSKFNDSAHKDVENTISCQSANDEEDDTPHTCSICINEFVNGASVVQGNKCNHIFHRGCLLNWLKLNNDICPVCRKDLMTSDEYLNAAKAVLGEDCVRKINFINSKLQG